MQEPRCLMQNPFSHVLTPRHGESRVEDRLLPAQNRRLAGPLTPAGLLLADTRSAVKPCALSASQGLGNAGTVESCSLDCSSPTRSGF